MKKISAVLVACALSGGASLSEASVQPLTLKEAVQFALEHSPRFDSEKKSQAIKDLQQKNAIAKLLPSLDLTTTNGLQNNIPIASTSGGNSILTPNPLAPWSSAFTLGLSETLYDNGASLTGISTAHLNRELASLTYEMTRDSLTLEVAAEFYRYSLAVVTLEAKKQQQQILEKQYKMLASQYQQGFKTKSDFLRIGIQVQQAEINRISAESEIAQSIAKLHKLIGIQSQLPDRLSFLPVPVKRERKLEALFPQSAPPLEKTYEYRMAQIQTEVFDNDVTLVKRKYWPMLSVTSALTYANQSYLNTNTPFAAGHQLSWNALFTLQYNFWDWGTRKHDVAIAELTRDRDQDNLTQNLLEVNAQISILMAELTKTRQSYKLSRDLLSIEEESYHNLELQYREGKASFLDLTGSIQSLLASQTQFYSSYFDGLTRIAQYQYFEGNIYEALIE